MKNKRNVSVPSDFLAGSDGVKANIRAPLRLKAMITDTSAAAKWPGASEHIPFIFGVKTARITKGTVPFFI